MKKRWLSLILALCMVLSLFPFSAFAESDGAEAGTAEFWAQAEQEELYVTPDAPFSLAVVVSDEALVTSCQWKIWNEGDSEWNDLEDEHALTLESDGVSRSERLRCSVA